MKKRLSNVEFVTELMTYSRRGALVQLFVMAALETYADAVLATDESRLAVNQLISASAWKDIAAEFKEKFEAHLSEKEPGGDVVQ
jgi:hypothetical protein